MSESTPPPLDRYHEIEIEKLFDAIMTNQNLRIQIGTFFGTINLATIGIAFSTQTVSLFFVAALLLLVYMYLDGLSRAVHIKLAFRSLKVKQEFALGETDDFLSVFIARRVAKEAQRILALNDKTKQERELSTYPIRHPSMLSVVSTFLAIIVEVGLGLVLLLGYGWRPF